MFTTFKAFIYHQKLFLTSNHPCAFSLVSHNHYFLIAEQNYTTVQFMASQFYGNTCDAIVLGAFMMGHEAQYWGPEFGGTQICQSHTLLSHLSATQQSQRLPSCRALALHHHKCNARAQKYALWHICDKCWQSAGGTSSGLASKFY